METGAVLTASHRTVGLRPLTARVLDVLVPLFIDATVHATVHATDQG